MTFEQLLESRRSVRNYKDKPVCLDIIKTLVKQSTFAPSAGNEQPWKFIIINNKDMINKISSESKKNIIARIESDPHDYAKKYEKMLRNEAFNIFYNAPVLILILGDANLKNLYVDCALAAGYLMMAAASKGLGSCWVNFGTEIKDIKLRQELGLIKNHKIAAPIILGYPMDIPLAPKRNDPQIISIIK